MRIVVILALALLIVACGDDELASTRETTPPPVEPAQTADASDQSPGVADSEAADPGAANTPNSSADGVAPSDDAGPDDERLAVDSAPQLESLPASGGILPSRSVRALHVGHPMEAPAVTLVMTADAAIEDDSLRVDLRLQAFDALSQLIRPSELVGLDGDFFLRRESFRVARCGFMPGEGRSAPVPNAEDDAWTATIHTSLGQGLWMTGYTFRGLTRAGPVFRLDIDNTAPPTVTTPLPLDVQAHAGPGRDWPARGSLRAGDPVTLLSKVQTTELWLRVEAAPTDVWILADEAELDPGLVETVSFACVPLVVARLDRDVTSADAEMQFQPEGSTYHVAARSLDGQHVAVAPWPQRLTWLPADAVTLSDGLRVGDLPTQRAPLPSTGADESPDELAPIWSRSDTEQFCLTSGRSLTPWAPGTSSQDGLRCGLRAGPRADHFALFEFQDDLTVHAILLDAQGAELARVDVGTQPSGIANFCFDWAPSGDRFLYCGALVAPGSTAAGQFSWSAQWTSPRQILDIADGELRLFREDGAALPFPAGLQATEFQLSPQRDVIAREHGGILTLTGLDGTDIAELGNASIGAWSDDGGVFVFYSDSRSRAHAYSPETGQVIALGPYPAVEPAPDGSAYLVTAAVFHDGLAGQNASHLLHADGSYDRPVGRVHIPGP